MCFLRLNTLFGMIFVINITTDLPYFFLCHHCFETPLLQLFQNNFRPLHDTFASAILQAFSTLLFNITSATNALTLYENVLLYLSVSASFLVQPLYYSSPATFLSSAVLEKILVTVFLPQGPLHS